MPFLGGDYNGSSAAASGSAGSGASTTASTVRPRIKDVAFNIHHNYMVHRVYITNQATVGEYTHIY